MHVTWGRLWSRVSHKTSPKWWEGPVGGTINSIAWHRNNLTNSCEADILNILTDTSSAVHNLALFVFTRITTSTNNIFSSTVAFLARALPTLYSTVFASATNCFTITFETAVTKLWSTLATRVSVAYNLAVIFWLKSKKVTKLLQLSLPRILELTTKKIYLPDDTAQ